MPVADTLIYELSADFRDLNRKFSEAERLIQNRSAQAARGFDAMNRSVTTVTRGIFSLRTAIAGLGLGVLAREVVQAAVSFERIQNGLRAATGSAQGAQREFAFLRRESERLGLDLETAAGSYTKLSAAARGTVLEGKAARDIFVAIAEASTVMGLSAEQTGGALTAIEQIISKGTVSAEELRGQLGERLPGAFQIAARAMGKTTQELGKMLEQGQLLADDLLPAMARELRKTFGPEVEKAAQSTQAQINRFKTTLFELQVQFGRSGFIDAFTDGLSKLRDTLKDPEFQAALRSFGRQMGEAMRFVVENADTLVRVFGAMAGARAGAAVGGLFPHPAGRAGGAVIGGTIGTLAPELFGPERAPTLGAVDTEIARLNRRLEREVLTSGEQERIFTRLSQLQDLRDELEALKDTHLELKSAVDDTLPVIEKSTDAWAKASQKAKDARDALKHQVNALQNEQLALQLSGKARDKVRIAQEVLTAQIKAGLEPTQKLTEAQKTQADTIAFLVREREKLIRSVEHLQRVEDLKGRIQLTREEIRLIGATNQQRTVAVAIMEKKNQLRALGVDLASEEAKTELELTRRLAESQAQLQKFTEQRELMLEPFKNALRGIQDAFTDAFENIFSGGVDSFADLASTVKRIFVRLAAEIASLLVFRPVVAGILGSIGLGGVAKSLGLGGALGAGSVGDGGGFSFNKFLSAPSFLPQFAKEGLFNLGAAFDPTGALGVDLVNIFTPANALGGFIGSLGANLLGLGGGIGGTIGGIGGSIAGAFIGGPIGAAVGGFLGTALGGLFGNKKSVGPNAGADFGNVGGAFGILNTSQHKGGPLGVLKEAAEKAAEGANLILEQLGATLLDSDNIFAGLIAWQKQGGFITTDIGGTPGTGGFNKNKRVFGQDAEAAVQDAIIRIFEGAIREDALEGISDRLAAAIRKSASMITDGDLEQFAFDIDVARMALGETAKQASAFDQAMEAVNERFDEMAKRASELGLSSFFIFREAERAREAVRLQFRAPYIQAAGGIADYLRVSAVQFQSPAQQLTAAQARFGDLLEQVRGGDISATGALLQSAENVRGLGRLNFASTVDFQNIDQFVRSSLASVGETLLSSEFFDKQVEATRQQTDVLSEDLQQVKQAIGDLRKEFRTWRLEIAA